MGPYDYEILDTLKQILRTLEQIEHHTKPEQRVLEVQGEIGPAPAQSLKDFLEEG